MSRVHKVEGAESDGVLSPDPLSLGRESEARVEG
jgi:hypothetical protein